MKIVCDACAAKYSIADEKVAGKVFKIRCKKCSNIIVVRGNAGEAAAAAAAAAPPAAAEQPGGYDEKETRVFDYQQEGFEDDGGGAVWHLVIDQEQVGPMTPEEIGQKYASGEVDAETYIWKEGFADWLPIAEVDDFAAMVAGGGTVEAAAAAAPAAAAGAVTASAATSDAVAGMFGGPQIEESNTARSDPADLFAAASGDVGGADDADDAGGADDAAGDLFGAPAASDGGGLAASGSMADNLFGGDGGGANGTAPDDDELEPQLRGQRNENSVLFSLGNLAALASDSKAASASPSLSAPSASASASASAAPTAGAAQGGGGEGSGLIDIRSMASAYLADKGAPSAGTGSDEDLPSFAATSFDQPSAVLLPTGVGSSSSGLSGTVLGLLVGIGVMAVAAIVLVVVLLTRDSGTQVAAQTPSGDTGKVVAAGDGDGDKAGGDGDKAPVAAGTDDTSGDGDGDKTGGDGDKAGGDGDGDKAPATKPKSGGDRVATNSKPKKPRSSSRKPRKPRSDKPKTPKPTKPKAPKGKCDEVSCLLSDNPPPCCSKYRGGSSSSSSRKKPTKTNSNLPEKLSRSDISKGMGKVRGRVSSCGDKHSGKGTVKVRVKVAGSGKVSSVSVKSSPNGSLGKCVSSSVKKARFSKTQGGGTFTYPFVFR